MSIAESERLDRMEQHLRLLKKDSEDKNAILNDIKGALVGNVYNGNKGLTHIIADIDKRVNVLEDDYAVTKENMRQIKVIGAAVLTFILSYILYLIAK